MGGEMMGRKGRVALFLNSFCSAALLLPFHIYVTSLLSSNEAKNQSSTRLEIMRSTIRGSSHLLKMTCGPEKLF